MASLALSACAYRCRDKARPTLQPLSPPSAPHPVVGCALAINHKREPQMGEAEIVFPGACATSSSGGRAIAGRHPDGACRGRGRLSLGGWCRMFIDARNFPRRPNSSENPNTAEAHGTLGLIVTKAEGGLRRVVALPKKTSPQRTHCWRKPDSNSWSPLEWRDLAKT